MTDDVEVVHDTTPRPSRKFFHGARPGLRVFSALLLTGLRLPAAEVPEGWLGPCALAVHREHGRVSLWIACDRSHGLVGLDLETQATRFLRLPAAPTGIVRAGRSGELIVTCASETTSILQVDWNRGRVQTVGSGIAGACSPQAAGGEGGVYVCSRRDDCVSRLDAAGKLRASGSMLREPVCATLSADRATLAVANLLPAGQATEPSVAACVTFLQAADLRLRGHVALPNGSSSIRGVAFDSEGKVCAAVHNIARFQVPTTQVEYGWMNASALSLISADGQLLGTVLLDEARRGAANPWGVAWAQDGTRLCITHAGTHELSVIDTAALQRKLAGMGAGSLVTDFGFLNGIRKRIGLPGKGPRALAVLGQVAYVAEYFTDTLAVVDLERGVLVETVALNKGRAGDRRREGEMLFNDATLGHQGWQSCASCHPGGRADGLNWDLLNDGIGNPKNTKSLVLSHQTPPAMSLGVRETAGTAARSGLRHILFKSAPEAVAQALDEYLKSLGPEPSPRLVEGKLSKAARRGRAVFAAAGCAGCHPPPLFTDLHSYDVGTRAPSDNPGDKFDTPTLVELWRTAPYLHDGSAATVRDVLTRHNLRDQHGKTSSLGAEQIDDLCAYLLSL